MTASGRTSTDEGAPAIELVGVAKHYASSDGNVQAVEKVDLSIASHRDPRLVESEGGRGGVLVSCSVVSSTGWPWPEPSSTGPGAVLLDEPL